MHNAVSVSMIEYEMAHKVCTYTFAELPSPHFSLSSSRCFLIPLLVQATVRNDGLVMGRIHLDTLINYRANYLFGTIR